MVKLLPSDIKTKEVLDWKGLHLLHAGMSSCSQKTRIFLNLKGLDWEGHYVDLSKNENNSPWFMGVNPRGLVPVLVHDGEVHIESNDIMLYAETLTPKPKLIPDESAAHVKRFLDLEDNMHMDLRTLTFRYVMPKRGDHYKDPEALARMLENGDGTVGGKADDESAFQHAWWTAANKNGITDEQVNKAVANFKNAFTMVDDAVATREYILGDTLSGVDIAWFIYSNRIRLAGYPLDLHPNLQKWFARLNSMEAFSKEIALPPPFEVAYLDNQAKMADVGDTLIKTANLAA